MKISGNCRSSRFVCPFFRRALYHAGYTGKSGSEASCHCGRTKKAIGIMKKCDIASNPEQQRNAWAKKLEVERAEKGLLV